MWGGGGGGRAGVVWGWSQLISQNIHVNMSCTLFPLGGGGGGTYPGLHSSDKTLTGLWVEMNRGQCVHACPCAACRVTCQHVMRSM